MTEYIVESVEDISIEGNYIVKGDGWFFIVNTKLEAEFLAEKLNSLKNEIDELKKLGDK